MALLREAETCAPLHPASGMPEGLRELEQSGWRWAVTDQNPLSPSLASAFQAHPPGPLVTRRPHAYTQAPTCPEPRSSTSPAALSACFEQRQLFSRNVLLGDVCPSFPSLSIPPISAPTLIPWEGRYPEYDCSRQLLSLQLESHALLSVVICAQIPFPK